MLPHPGLDYFYLHIFIVVHFAVVIFIQRFYFY